MLLALVGALAALLRPVQRLEADLGLAWLFEWRGARAAPESVVVVGIDRASARRWQLPNLPRLWPRRLHAELIDRLHAAGATAIAFDVIFSEARDPADDAALAAALRRAGNVLLVEYLQREAAPWLGEQEITLPAGLDLRLERRLPLLPEFAAAALAQAPFPLPKVPARVNETWLFKTGAGGTATLPVAAYVHYMHAVQRRFEELLMASGLAPTAAPSPALRALHCREALTDPALRSALERRLAELPAAQAPPLRALRELYTGPETRYLNFYGPARSVRTLSYHEVLEARDPLALDLAGKAVFVGYSEPFQPEQRDAFYSVYTGPDGGDVSGVEIAATTFANLTENRFVRPLPTAAAAALLALWGAALGLVCGALPRAWPVPAALLLGAVWIGAARWLFADAALWLPLVTPLLLQLPLALLLGLLGQYLIAYRQRLLLGNTFAGHVPSALVDAALAGEPMQAGERTFGVVLASDAEQYTRLAETMSPEAVRTLMNRYFACLMAPVQREGGRIADVAGDALIAIWSGAEPAAMRAAACRAALAMQQAVADFNAEHAATPLPTRIGLHCGELMLGLVGATGRYAFRAVGDAVNTASRIEALNKRLGTRVLASAQVVEGLDFSHTRPLGRFQLRGKRTPLTIHELLAAAPEAPGGASADAFAAALAWYREGRLDEASAAFTALRAMQPDDGPARFYQALCHQVLCRGPRPDTAPAAWDDAVPESELRTG